jgi:Arc/MetJ-type ribon-helix-helix transcriptional regulator
MATAVRFWLPEDLKQFVVQKVQEGGYISGAEYLRDLIRQHRRRKTNETAAPPPGVVHDNLHPGNQTEGAVCCG